MAAETYADPGQFLFGALVGTTISVLLNIAARPKETAPLQTAALPANTMPLEMTGYSVGDLQFALSSMESSMKPGEKVRLQLLTDEMPTQEDLEDFYSNMVIDGHHASMPTARVVGNVFSTELVLQKGSPSLALLIPMIPTAIIAGLITFGITKLSDITRALFPLILITAGSVIILAAVLTRKPVLEAAGRTKYLR